MCIYVVVVFCQCVEYDSMSPDFKDKCPCNGFVTGLAMVEIFNRRINFKCIINELASSNCR